MVLQTFYFSNEYHKEMFYLQVISLEGWSDIMYYVQDAHSFWDWIYFVLLIVVSIDVYTNKKSLFTFCLLIKSNCKTIDK